MQMFSCVAAAVFLVGCAHGAANLSLKHSFRGDPDKQKDIFVFLDGTKNDPSSRTNVWKLYDLLDTDNAPQMTAVYIDGVGSLHDKPVTGAVLGRGMEDRILEGYKYIAQHYRPGDNIYIFGFSRGAHQARALAGFLAYAGIPIVTDNDHDHLIRTGNSILELLKKKSDEDFLNKWASWKPKQAPLLAAEIKKKLDLEMQPAEITFLGVWDTVPGSSLKKYAHCKEIKGIVKKYLYWLIPGVDKGDRYKSDSYPPIHQIAHALSIDEKRSKFKPLLLCEPINPEYTKLYEVWFPGAHADVGGGYGDSDELSGISLNWMIGLLAKSYNFNTTTPRVKENPKGLAHWSIGDFPANTGSECEDRPFPPVDRVHSSFFERKDSSPVPICREGREETLGYPITCPAK